jgi:hypothetical protein
MSIFREISVGIVCDQCKLLPPDLAAACRCEDWKQPDHLSFGKNQRYSGLFKHDPMTYLREFFGIESYASNQLLSEDLVDEFLAEDNVVEVLGSPHIVWLFMDPGGGGKSKSAFSAWLISPYFRVVCSLRSFWVTDPLARLRSRSVASTQCLNVANGILRTSAGSAYTWT